MAAFALTLIARLRALAWPHWRAQAGRQLLALLAIALGVALAYGVHLLNASALAEFGAARAQLAGTPDLLLRGRDGAPLSEDWLARLAERPEVRLAAPVIEAEVQLLPGRQGLRLLGMDALQSAQLRPALLPQPFSDEEAGPLEALAPDAIFLNEAALRLLPQQQPRPARLELRLATREGAGRSLSLRLAGRVAAGGAPLAVLDIAAAQALLGRLGGVDRIELRLQEGAALPLWPPELRAETPSEAAESGAQDLAALSRAYRVNLGVLSLMALFTGSFLVFAVQSLAQAQRLPQLALLGVLGLSARERAALILAEAALLGLAGSLLGLLLGTGLAALGLRLLGGDLGSGMLAGAALHPGPWAPLLFGGLGLVVAVGSALGPAWRARRMAPAQVLKGLGQDLAPALHPALGLALLAAGGGLALLPAWDGLPLAAYLAMLCLLFGGLLLVPALVRLLGRAVQPRSAARLLLRQRALEHAGDAAQLLAGVLVALALSVAMLVMVNSFRASLNDWLRQMLPADLYLRSGLRAADGARAPLPPALVDAVRASGLAREVHAQRSRRLELEGETVQLQARPLPDARRLPLAGPPAAAPATDLAAVYVNEPLRDRLALRPGQALTLPLGEGRVLRAYVAGIWRDYARQSGALLLDLADYRRASGDPRVTELYLWLAPDADMAAVQTALRALAAEPQDIELAASGELLALSLRLFDRSFAVTYWLQAIALGLGLVGVAAALSAQVLARRREFGLLLHLGLTRAQVLRLLLAETALYALAGALLGLLLGLAISAVLVFVVNPQSFHWSMDLALPWPRLMALLAITVAAALASAWLAGRHAGRQDALQAVKDDW